MQTSFHAFMVGLVDYAGLFPPASLELDEAIRNFAYYRSDDDAWMLSRFIIPASRLPELESYHDELFEWGLPFRFSVLAGGGADENEFFSNLQTDLWMLEAFRNLHGERVIADVVEIKLPPTIVGDSLSTSYLLQATADMLQEKAGRTLTPFFEIIPGSSWRDEIQVMTHKLATLRRDWPYLRLQKPCFKLRTGGVTADAFPSAELIAHTIAACRDLDIPLKATAGLHHPIRHHNDSVDTTMHGFLNVFGAGLMAQIHDWDAGQIQAMLEDEDPDSFSFGDTFSWKDHHLSSVDIRLARTSFMTSFGSCSFDEPRDDLRELGHLPPLLVHDSESE